MTALRSALGKTESSSGTDSERENLNAVYDLLKANPKFLSAFPSNDTLVNLYTGWVKKSILMMNHRKNYYDKDASSCVETLNATINSIPELNLADTSPFCAAMKEHEQVLLRQCDLAGELLASVRNDVAAFGCTETSLLSNFTESWQLN